ncbi:MAG TPA: HlyD family secretion protein [Candidatus Rubrimentiphilum sp.]|nr:HlyD family secretion protein [Candidatus Rubrimentiphilum sp.]
MDTLEQTNVTRGDVPAGVVETGPNRNFRPLLIAAGVVVAILLSIWLIRWYAYARVHQSTDDARIDANTVAITSKINERVDRILTDTDKPVHKGQVLIVLDNASERAALDQAQANLQLAMQNQQAGIQQGSGAVAQAQGEVQGAAAQVPVAQAGASAAQAQVQAAQAALPGAAQALTRARADYERTLSLVRSGDLPRQQLDAIRAAYALAQSQYRAAQDNVNVAIANLNAAEQRIGAAQAGVSAAQGGVQSAQGKLSQAQGPATVAVAQAAVALARQNLANTRIVSPIEGYVGEKQVDVGQTVSAGLPLLTLIPNRVFITANFKETQVGSMHAGQPVDISVDAYKGVAFHGRVIAINPASQNTYALIPTQNSTGNFVKVTQRIPVRISIDDADTHKYPMRPGMSVEASVLVR